MSLAFALLLTCAACGEEDAPADDVAEAAEDVIAPAAEATPFAKGRFAPRDECGGLEGASDFRMRLTEAVRLRDAGTIAALAADDVKLDFGGGEGTAELKARLGDPERELWRALDELLTLGCAASEDGGITIPWFFAQEMGEIDPYSALLVMGEDVPVLAEPRASAERLDAITWDLVEAASYYDDSASSDPEAPFQKVRVAGGGIGFIATEKLRSLIDYRLIASSRNGRWRITSFVAGD
jgi:hypothetical protein